MSSASAVAQVKPIANGTIAPMAPLATRVPKIISAPVSNRRSNRADLPIRLTFALFLARLRLALIPSRSFCNAKCKAATQPATRRRRDLPPSKIFARGRTLAAPPRVRLSYRTRAFHRIHSAFVSCKVCDPDATSNRDNARAQLSGVSPEISRPSSRFRIAASHAAPAISFRESGDTRLRYH